MYSLSLWGYPLWLFGVARSWITVAKSGADTLIHVLTSKISIHLLINNYTILRISAAKFPHFSACLEVLQNHPKTWSYFWLENRCGLWVSQFDTHWATSPPNTSELGQLSSQKKKNKKSWHTPPLLSKIIPNTAVSNPFLVVFLEKLLRTITFSELKTPPGGIDQQRNNFEEFPVETNSLDVMKLQCEIQTWIAENHQSWTIF